MCCIFWKGWGESLKKDNIRDYATEAFRFYAACGRLTAAQLEQIVRDRIYEQSKREYRRSGLGMHTDATAYAVMQAEDAVREMQAEFEDILAVERTLKRLTYAQRRAVELVYFAEPKRELERNDISDRVHQAELAIPASERSIYGWLARARRIFAEERGLRLQRSGGFASDCTPSLRKGLKNTELLDSLQ